MKGGIKLRFSFNIDHLPAGPIELALEQPQSFRVQLNGNSIDTAKEKMAGWWVDRSIQRIAIPSEMLRKGDNQLQLETDFHEDINLEAVYLLGDFGVRVDGDRVTLTTLPATLKPSDITSQGLPFYGGGIRYHLPIPRAASQCNAAFGIAGTGRGMR